MIALLRTLHVIALAVWLGSVVFFTIAGVLIFAAFEEVSRLPQGDQPRPDWFPLPEMFNKDSPDQGFPNPLRLEQGSRAGGAVVSKIFPVYFLLQTICAAIAMFTALLLLKNQGGRLDTVRLIVCALGLAAVLVGWWLERYVSELREPRNDRTDIVLKATHPAHEQIMEARQARAAFGKWHGVSLLVNFATLVLALLATVLAAHLAATSRNPVPVGMAGGDRPG
jgi:hypothetical protein